MIAKRLWRGIIRAAIEFCYLYSRVPFARGYGRLRNLIIRLDGVGDAPFKFKRRGVAWELYLQNHSFLDRHVMFAGAYERESTEFIENLIQPGWYCMDVGANVGYYTLLMAKRAGRSGRIYAFEPVPEFRDRLNRHIELNRAENVVVAPVALSNSEGEGTIYVSSMTAKMRTPSPWDEPHAKVVLHRTTLDRYCEDNGVTRIDFMKIDIDGHEGAFLDGARRTLSRFLPTLLIEISPRDNADGVPGVTELCRRLVEIGYQLCSEDARQRYPDEKAAMAALLQKNPNGGNIVCIPISGNDRPRSILAPAHAPGTPDTLGNSVVK
jgi:FkbM family methyltransferase